MEEFARQHPSAWVFAFPFYFVALWAVVCLLISLVGGWWGLARRYRTQKAFPDHKRRLQRGQMRCMTGYNGVLTVASDAEGVYLAMMFLFRLAHPPLFIPWSDIEVETPVKWIFVMLQTLRLGPDRIPLRLREPLARFLLEGRAGAAPPQPGGLKWGI